MAKMTGKPQLKLEIILVLEESEARALAAITRYKISDVIKGIETVVPPSVVEDNHPGLYSFLKSCESMIWPILDRANTARAVFHKDD